MTEPMAMVVHPHFHFRRTGTTSHVEAVVAELQGSLEARAVGLKLDPRLPRVGLREVWARSARERVVWHAHRNNELMVGLALRALRPNVRVVFTRHAATRPSFFTRWLFNRADEVVSLTREVAEEVARPSAVIGHGVDLGRFRPPASRAAAFASLGLGGARGLGVIGRIRPEKGQGDFVRAVAPLLPKLPAWRGVLVGRVKRRDRAFARALLASAPEQLTWVAEQRDVLPWYQGLTIVVQPSHSEGFSLVLLEALAAGCCVVAARLPHFPLLVRHGETGFLYPPGDVEALRAILARLMEGPALAEEVGRRAAEDAKARLGLDEEARSLLRLYRPLLGGAP